MSSPRRARDLRTGDLPRLPEPCRACVRWERMGPTGPAPAPQAAAKEAWWQSTELEWGAPGKGLYDGDRLVGYALSAPASAFPWTRRAFHAVSEDAVLLATLWVDPAYRSGGLGSVLLQSVLRDTYRRGQRAIEAYGVRTTRPLREGGCLLPESFLLAAGFAVVREHYRHPLLRLDLNQTVRWQWSLGQALEGVRSALTRGERAPVPTGSATMGPLTRRPSTPAR